MKVPATASPFRGLPRIAKVSLIVVAMMGTMAAIAIIADLDTDWYSWFIGFALSLVVAVQITSKTRP